MRLYKIRSLNIAWGGQPESQVTNPHQLTQRIDFPSHRNTLWIVQLVYPHSLRVPAPPP